MGVSISYHLSDPLIITTSDNLNTSLHSYPNWFQTASLFWSSMYQNPTVT